MCVTGADIRTVNMRELTSGVLHTKFWIVDKKHIYIGSANMDWRSLTQVFQCLIHINLFTIYRLGQCCKPLKGSSQNNKLNFYNSVSKTCFHLLRSESKSKSQKVSERTAKGPFTCT